MPLYTYRAKDAEKSCPYCHDLFETLQRMSEEALTTCPECGTPVVRVMHGAAVMQQKSTKQLLSDDNLRKHGFKKLVNAGGGKFDEVV
jgi:putative FmdB family regulatory protein